MKYGKYLLIALLVILIDHASKLGIYYNFEIGEEVIVIDDWFRLHYLLNPGMAFGMQFNIPHGKLILSVFRIFATIGIAWYMFGLVKKNVHSGFLLCMALILGGAIGNGIDSIFYGVLLEGNVIPGSITPWFHGRVIDMLYFPMFDGYFPEWFPVIGGRYFNFFSAIFNIADSSIFLGAVGILLFQKKFFPEHQKDKQPAEAIRTEARLTSDVASDGISVEDTLEVNREDVLDEGSAIANETEQIPKKE